LLIQTVSFQALCTFTAAPERCQSPPKSYISPDQLSWVVEGILNDPGHLHLDNWIPFILSCFLSLPVLPLSTILKHYFWEGVKCSSNYPQELKVLYNNASKNDVMEAAN